MDTSIENRNRYTAIGLTIGIHAALFLIFLFVVFITPLPPFVTPGPLILEWNNSAENGSADAGIPAAAAMPHALKPLETGTAITDPAEKDVLMKTEKNADEAKAGNELLNALSALKGKKGGGTGHSTENKTGVSPTGTESGIELRGLADRQLISKPERLTDATEEGIVIVRIVVDETGKVIRATPGQRGSTTVSAVLNAKARQAALALRFNESAEGISEQHGTYTFVFTLE